MRLLRFAYEHLGQSVVVECNPEPGPLLDGVVGNLGLTLLVGPNGSGKSTLVSNLVRLLHHVDRKHERIPSTSSVEYHLSKSDTAITVSHRAGEVSLAFDGHARTVRDSSRSRAEPRDDTLIDLLPNTICSVFSTRGEYPAQKAGNARGLRHTSLYDIAALYGRHHYNIGSLSAGLSRLVSPGFEAARRALATLAGLHVGTDVKVFPTQRLTRQALASVPEFLWRSEQTWDFEQAEWSRLRQHLPWLATDWIPVDPEVLQAEADGLVYINDVVLTSANSRRFSLMTLSAGQKMLLVRLLSILSKVSDDSLVILEEPELHLDPLWCGSLLELLGAFFGRFRAHLVVTTQNLSVMRCFPAQTVIAMNDGRPSPLHQRTFLASEAVVADLVYRGQALSTLDELVLARLAGLGDLSNRESAVALLGEGPVRFLARRAVADSGRS